MVYSEPAGEWLIVPDVIWKIHDQYRDAAVAEDIAWLAVQNGLPGECEGYVPCDAQGMNTLDGEYLRRYPRGAARAGDHRARERRRWSSRCG